MDEAYLEYCYVFNISLNPNLFQNINYVLKDSTRHVIPLEPIFNYIANVHKRLAVFPLEIIFFLKHLVMPGLLKMNIVSFY